MTNVSASVINDPPSVPPAPTISRSLPFDDYLGDIKTDLNYY